MSSNAKSTLARLLAKENITVQHGNFKTAFFDVQSRVLGLPAWKDMSTDVNDLMIGHEVGHALHTPADFNLQLNGIRHDIVNLVEDVRIERIIQGQYPGLVGCFTRGYETLHQQDFFGIKGTDVNTLGFLNRLNIKFKLRNLIDIEFSAEELPIKTMIESANTWQEVLAASRALQNFVNEAEEKQKQEAQQQAQAVQVRESSQESSQSDEQSPEDQSENSDEDSSSSGSTDAESSEDESSEKNGLQTPADDSGESESDSGSSEPGADSQDASKPAKSGNDSSQSSGENQDSTDATCTNVSNKIGGNKASSDTDLSTQSNFDSRCQSDLNDTSRETLATRFLRLPSQQHRLSRVMSYAKLHETRMMHLDSDFARSSKVPERHNAFEQYLRANKPIIAMMVKEFELRKSAHQYARATVSKTGSLNLEKLHAYRTSDDIFLSVTKLADAKNHGMVMFVDYSGSMGTVLPHVLKHLINMSLFCRQAGIPFAVYAFTSGGAYTADPATERSDHVVMSNMILMELISSELSKDQFKQALFGMWIRTVDHRAAAACESLGGTPLNEAVIIAHDIIDQFKAKHNPDKMTAIFLTDGVGGRMGSSTCNELDSYRIKDPNSRPEYSWSDSHCGRMISFQLKGRTIKFDNSKPQAGTNLLIENLRLTTGCHTLGFFIPARRSKYWTEVAIREANAASPLHKQSCERLYETYRRNSVVSIPGAYCYDNYFVVGGGNDLAIDDDDELEIDSSMTRSKIAREFMNFSSSKKSKRVFVTKFSEAIA